LHYAKMKKKNNNSSLHQYNSRLFTTTKKLPKSFTPTSVLSLAVSPVVLWCFVKAPRLWQITSLRFHTEASSVTRPALPGRLAPDPHHSLLTPHTHVKALIKRAGMNLAVTSTTVWEILFVFCDVYSECVNVCVWMF
jgi:hypothetical protein